VYEKGSGTSVWLIILIIAAVIGMIFLLRKIQKNYIEKLTSTHFANEESFDKKAFVHLIDALQKSRRNAWKMPVIWAVGILLAAVFADMGGALGHLLSVACIFAGLIGGNLSVKGDAKRIKAAMKELGATQKDINAAIKQIKTKSQQRPAGTAASVESAQKPTPTKGARKLFIVSSVLVIMIHAFMILAFIVNAIDETSQIAQYSIFAIGSVLAIVGVVLMMKKKTRAYALVVIGIVLFCIGLNDEFHAEETIVILALMIALSAMLLFAALRLQRKEYQAASGMEPKPFLRTKKQLLWTAAVTTVVILVILLLPKGKYEQTFWRYDLYEAQLRKTGKWGFIDRTKKQEIVPCIYDKTDRTYNILKVKLDDKWGMFNKSGKEIIPCRYDFIGDELKDSFLYIMNNGKHGLIRFDGREVVPCIYDEQLRSESSSGLLKAVLEDKYGFIDHNGNVIVPILYDDVNLVANGRFIRTDLEGENIYFDLQGNKVDNDQIPVTQKQAMKSVAKMMKVNYDSQKETFTFTDVETGEPLEYNRIMLGNAEPAGMRYYHSQQGGSMIQFVTKAKEVLNMRQENGRTVTTYSEESTTAFPLYKELPYTLEGDTLIIKRQ
jgi:nicotinamide riboside transporter PnuC